MRHEARHEAENARTKTFHHHGIMTTKTIPLYAAIASLLACIDRCSNTGNFEWRDRHQDRLDALLRDHLPSGSGLDHGVQLLEHECKSNKLVLQADYHHMDQDGYYAGWTLHQVVVTPSLEMGAVIKITGRDRNAIKDYLADLFHQVMFTEVNPYGEKVEA